MTDREVYTQAAMNITHNFYFSCNAIFYPAKKNNPGTIEHRNKYRAAFGFESDLVKNGEGYDWTLYNDSFLDQFPEGLEGRELRVMCLLMMAAACGDL